MLLPDPFGTLMFSRLGTPPPVHCWPAVRTYQTCPPYLLRAGCLSIFVGWLVVVMSYRVFRTAGQSETPLPVLTLWWGPLSLLSSLPRLSQRLSLSPPLDPWATTTPTAPKPTTTTNSPAFPELTSAFQAFVFQRLLRPVTKRSYVFYCMTLFAVLTWYFGKRTHSHATSQLPAASRLPTILSWSIKLPISPSSKSICCTSWSSSPSITPWKYIKELS